MPGRTYSRGVSMPPRPREDARPSIAAGQRQFLLDQARHAVREVQLKLFLKASPAAIVGSLIGANDAIRAAASGPRTNGRPILDPVPQLPLDATPQQVDQVLSVLDAAMERRGPA